MAVLPLALSVWRYNYPRYDETSGYVKVPSQQLSDALVEAFKDRLKAD